jgi:hypothetical protein
MKIICKMLGGSRAYGLENESSDYDYRGVFLNTDVNTIIGLDKNDHVEIPGEDTKYKELRRFLNLLKRGNTEAMEILFSEEYIEVDPLFLDLKNRKYSFVSSVNMFKCLRGYMQGELKLSNGERTGQLGSKRKEAIEKYGFSPKNFCSYFRLAQAGITLFNNGYFTVRVEGALREFLLKIKNNPEFFKVEDLNALAIEKEKQLVLAFEDRVYDHTFDDALANEYIFKAYYPLLQSFA